MLTIIVEITVKTLRSMRRSDESTFFRMEVESLASARQVQEPVLPRMKISLEELEVGSAP